MTARAGWGIRAARERLARVDEAAESSFEHTGVGYLLTVRDDEVSTS